MTNDEIKRKIEEIDNKISYLENMILITKIKINSLYGFLSTPFSRYYDIRLSTAITYQGQVSIKGVGEYIIQKNPYLIYIYSDTDSTQLSLEPLINKRFGNTLPNKDIIVDFILKYQERILKPNINEFFDKLSKNLNAFKSAIKMEFELLSDIAIYIEKKKYALKIINKDGKFYLDKPKLKIKGIEVVRTSTPQIVRDKLRRSLELIFDTADNKVLIDFIEEFKKEFRTKSFEEVAFPRGVNFSNYTLRSPSLPIQVRAAFIYNKALDDFKLSEKYPKIGDGAKIKFCYIKMPNKFGSNVIACNEKLPEEFRKEIQIDYDLQFAKTMISPIEKILSTIGWNVEDVAVLDDFF